MCKLIADVRANGAGHNYLVQHSAGSGKSNSIAWTTYRLASLHDENSRAIFSSVIVVTDRTVLDAQLQETISGFDHTIGAVETIGENKNSKDLRDAINNGVRIIVTTLQKFPVIYTEVDRANGRNYAILEAFQPFYQETYLQQEVNVDLIYQTQKELRGSTSTTRTTLRPSLRSTSPKAARATTWGR